MDERIEEKREKLVRILEALAALEGTDEWNTLRELVFEPSKDSILRRMTNEARSAEIKTQELYRLQGEYAWASRFCDIPKYAEVLKKQLQDLNSKK